MRNVTIFRDFTVLETFELNGVQVDRGYDGRLEVFYRANLCIGNIDDIAYMDCYYGSIDDLKEDLDELHLVQKFGNRS